MLGQTAAHAVALCGAAWQLQLAWEVPWVATTQQTVDATARACQDGQAIYLC